ncbi:MAG: hypothetical protein DI570_17130 [Phenylobacterium zucineum]|nr:MAG: hypothetical protein DI570_17130 [Phenylobacterium zucineum]
MLTTPAQPDLPDAAYLQAAVAAAPFHRWLSLKVVRIDADGIELAMPWREELISNPKRRTANSTRSWARIPRDGGHGFHGIVGAL